MNSLEINDQMAFPVSAAARVVKFGTCRQDLLGGHVGADGHSWKIA